MRVTLATFDDDPPLGGQGVLARDLRAALRRRGMEVATVAGRGASAIRFARVTGRPPLDLSIALNRRPDRLLGGAPDVVHLMGGPGGVLLLRRLPVPAVYTANHTYRQAYGRTAPRRAVGALEARAYRRADAVLAISASTADAVRAMGVDAGRVEVVMPGVDTGRIAAVARTVAREPGRMLFVGRLERHKGPLDAVAVMAQVCARLAPARGVVVGRGPLDGAVRAAASAVPGERVTVLGEVDDDRLVAEYARAGVLVVPSSYEGLGLVALEALSAGAAVAGYDVTGLRDAAATGGALVPQGDVGALADAVTALFRDEGRRAALAAAGRERVVAEHSWDAAAARVEEVYRRVLAAG